MPQALVVHAVVSVLTAPGQPVSNVPFVARALTLALAGAVVCRARIALPR